MQTLIYRLAALMPRSENPRAVGRRRQHGDEALPSPEVNPFETLEQHSQRLAKEKRIAELKQKPQGECGYCIMYVEALNDEELPATFNHEELEALVSAGKWTSLILVRQEN